MPPSILIPTMGIKPLFRCPYCPRNFGVVAVDLDAVLVPRADGERAQEVVLTGEARHPIVVFDPDTAAGRPCPHLVDFTVAGWVERAAGRRDPKRLFDFIIDWKHQWFVDHDRERVAHAFLWQVVAGDDEQAFWPASSYRIKWVGRTVRVPGTGLRVCFGLCSFVTALHPERFCRELLEGNRRLQEFWSREDRAGA